jgi:hypothetical protein
VLWCVAIVILIAGTVRVANHRDDRPIRDAKMVRLIW